MNPELWKLVASIGGVLITVVTGPIIWAIRAESKAIRKDQDLIRAEMKLLGTELKGEMKLLGVELRGEMTAMESRLKGEMTTMESRLNERIDTRLVHR